ncbi:MAG: AI-2E family transporter [Elusimicrobia bacterium]|nr:AI-2E family transporter [Elusimicrobiota bacterium]
MNRQQLFRWFFFGALLLLLYQLLRILSPFFSPILCAVVLCLVFYPIHHRILKLLPQHHNPVAALTTAVVSLMVILPFTFFLWILFREAAVIYPALERWTEAVQELGDSAEGGPVAWLENLQKKTEFIWSLLHVDFRDVVGKSLAKLSASIAVLGKQAAKNIFILLLDFLVMIFTLFFLFRDGKDLLTRIRDLIPMEPEHKELLVQRFYETTSAVVRAAIANAAAQGFLAGVGFWIVGTHIPVALGFLAGLFSLIPFGGASLIWLPVAVYFLTQEPLWRGIFLLIWGMGVISVVDNFIKPIIIGGRARLPFLLLFFGIFGGLRVYGPLGILLGPITITLVLALIKIYREEYHHK